MSVETEKEVDRAWIADVLDLPVVLAYGRTRGDATAKVKSLALRLLADRSEHGEAIPELAEAFHVAVFNQAMTENETD